MRTLTAAQTKVLGLASYQVRARVKIDDSTGVMRDLSALSGVNWVQRIEYGSDVNTPLAHATIRLRREMFSLSLAPLAAGSKLNNLTGSYIPLIAHIRALTIETATIPDGAIPVAGDWQLVFDGFVDTIDPGSGDSITVRCSDKGSALRGRCVIRPVTGNTPKIYVSTAQNDTTTAVAVQTVMQQIINDQCTTNGVTAPTLAMPVDPLWSVHQFAPRLGDTTFDVVRNLALQIGYECRYKWNGSAFALTFSEPPRTSTTSLYTLAANQYYDVRKLETDADGVRNIISIGYYNLAVLDNVGAGTLTFVEVSDATSKTKYGHRWMQVCTGGAQQIDNGTQATAMANAILRDMKDPAADGEIDCRYFWPAEINDIYTFKANNIHFSTDQKWAVVGIRNVIDETHMRTTLTTRGTPCGSLREWHIRGAHPGVGKPIARVTQPTPTITIRT